MLEAVGAHRALEFLRIRLQRGGCVEGGEDIAYGGSSFISTRAKVQQDDGRGRESTLDQCVAVRAALEVLLQTVRGALADEVLGGAFEGSSGCRSTRDKQDRQRGLAHGATLESSRM